jgi:hypothetical protein
MGRARGRISAQGKEGLSVSCSGRYMLGGRRRRLAAAPPQVLHSSRAWDQHLTCRSTGLTAAGMRGSLSKPPLGPSVLVWPHDRGRRSIRFGDHPEPIGRLPVGREGPQPPAHGEVVLTPVILLSRNVRINLTKFDSQGRLDECPSGESQSPIAAGPEPAWRSRWRAKS